jgi:hypothetical protein
MGRHRPLLLALLIVAAAGCGGGDSGAVPAGTAPATTPSTTAATPAAEPLPATTEAPIEAPAAEALPGLPAELAGYEGWRKLNDAPLPRRASDPHDGTKDVFASRPAGADGTFPDGAIVVKEATRPDADFVGLVAMMRKERGSNPEHADWVMVEWVRDGPDEPFRELASGAVCTSCHVQARATDYVFTR